MKVAEVTDRSRDVEVFIDRLKPCVRFRTWP